MDGRILLQPAAAAAAAGGGRGGEVGASVSDGAKGNTFTRSLRCRLLERQRHKFRSLKPASKPFPCFVALRGSLGDFARASPSRLPVAS